MGSPRNVTTLERKEWTKRFDVLPEDELKSLDFERVDSKSPLFKVFIQMEKIELKPP